MQQNACDAAVNALTEARVRRIYSSVLVVSTNIQQRRITKAHGHFAGIVLVHLHRIFMLAGFFNSVDNQDLNLAKRASIRTNQYCMRRPIRQKSVKNSRFVIFGKDKT